MPLKPTRWVHTAEDLRKALNLSLDVRDGVAVLAEKEKVVVVIDQLDAISELLDIKSGRLNVLLNLIHNLSGQKGVHIIASSREFEYRHDSISRCGKAGWSFSFFACLVGG